MIEIEQEKNRKTRCLLIGAPKVPLDELEGLCDTLGMETARSFSLTRLEVRPAYGMGSGKAQEICALAHELECDCIIFDWELDPTKQRNWERLAKLPCFDRQEVILRIFAQRAQTKEAVLQVELARMIYSLPRLAHMYGDMARQRGGNYGSKGSGEKQLELDQRQVRERIQKLRKQLKEVEKVRSNQRKKRSREGLVSCALAGYTNAGKSSLLNALTGAEAFVENKLFATLDPQTRRLTDREGNVFLFTDTVGFISNLPHSLVDAFKSTLEETLYADILLIVIDASDEKAFEQYEVVLKVLEETGASDKKKIIVLNKTDLIKDDAVKISCLREAFPDSVEISVKERQGLENLLERIRSDLIK